MERPGRPKLSYKWKVEGQPVPAQTYYKHKRILKTLEENKQVQNSDPMLERLIKIRDEVEELIKVKLKLRI